MKNQGFNNRQRLFVIAGDAPHRVCHFSRLASGSSHRCSASSEFPSDIPVLVGDTYGLVSPGSEDTFMWKYAPDAYCGNGRWQVSLNGGMKPRWRSDGRELYYVENHSVLMSLPVATGQGLTLGLPRRLFESADLNFRALAWPQYDVSADGQRFLTSTPVREEDENAPPVSIRIVQNWFAEFKNRQ